MKVKFNDRYALSDSNTVCVGWREEEKDKTRWVTIWSWPPSQDTKRYLSKEEKSHAV